MSGPRRRPGRRRLGDRRRFRPRLGHFTLSLGQQGPSAPSHPSERLKFSLHVGIYMVRVCTKLHSLSSSDVEAMVMN